MTEQGPDVSPVTPEQGEALTVVLLDQSRDARDEARDRADARLDQELGEGGRMKRFLSGIWKGNIAKEYYRQRYTHQALETIQAANDVLVTEATDTRARALEATIERFTSEHDELIHTEAGERREVQAEESQLTGGIKHLIREFTEGRLSADALQEERTRLLGEYRKQHGEAAIGKGIVTADNLLAIAQTVAGAVEHGESLDYALSRLQVITGEARNGVRTEARYTAVDTVIDTLARTRVGSLVTPGVLATGVAAAAALARAGSHSVVGAATKTLLPGAAAGAWAGLRENKRVKDERAQYAREMAMGNSFQEGDARRIEMETARYESIPAQDLIAHLRTTAEAEALHTGGNEAVQAALDALAAVQARVQLSDSKKVDLISYSSKSAVGEERMLLDLARREARLTVESRLSNEVRQALGIDQEADIKDILQVRAGAYAEALTNGSEGMSEKDKIFAQLKRRRVAKAAALGVATGVIGGLVVQEAVAGVDPTRHGLIDSIQGHETAAYGTDGEVHQTLLAGALRGDETSMHTSASSEYVHHSIGERGAIDLSSDHSLVSNPDGTLNLVAGNGEVTVEGLVVDANGAFDQASLDTLDAAGMIVEDASYNETITTTTTEQVSVDHYLQRHADSTTHITRDFWYGNDTPGVYDHNEVRLHFGGSAEAPGIVEGGYQYSVAGMSPEGSWQGSAQVDWNQAADKGTLFAAISPTFDTQTDPIMVPINSDGSLFIAADSPAGKFFSGENSATFNGAYMEIVETASVDSDGTVHVRPLATLVGNANIQEVTDTVTTTSIEHHAVYTITSNGYDTVQGNFTEMAPITPIASRRSMEALRSQPGATVAERAARMEAPGAGYYSGEVSREAAERIKREVSPRLRNNPDAQLNPKEELDWYRNELVSHKGEEYVRDIEAFIQNNPELRALSPSVESLVVMPVRGISEGDTIYKTLSLFGQQEREPGKKTTLLLNVNWLDTVIGDTDNVAAIQKTLREIERAQTDFPNLSIVVMQKEYKKEVVEATGGPLGYITDDLINTALLAAQNSMANGTIDSDHDMIIIRSDADVNGQSRKQVTNFEKAARENPTVDVLKGVTRFGVRDYDKFPGFGIVTNFSTALALAGSQENAIHTGGANFGVRASTLAAVGGLGELIYTGAASDDVEIGRRISVARDVGSTVGSYGASTSSSDAKRIRRVSYVAGAAIDTNAERLLPYYIQGRSFQEAWSDTSRGFGSGVGGYAARNSAEAVMAGAQKERYPNDASYEAIEVNISQELQYASARAAKRALAVFFGSVPGAYTIEGKVGTPEVKLTLTPAGREYIKHRVERETNGRYGSYGLRKMRQLYGELRPGAKRTPASETPPLVSPLT